MTFKSEVIKGRGLGRKIGFPTLNLCISDDFGLEEGVYVCRILILGEKYKGVMHFGTKTVGGPPQTTLEVYVLDFDKEVYGEVVEVETGEKLREVKKFNNVKNLKKQIKEDVAKAKEME